MSKRRRVAALQITSTAWQLGTGDWQLATADGGMATDQYPMSKSNFQVNGERPVISESVISHQWTASLRDMSKRLRLAASSSQERRRVAALQITSTAWQLGTGDWQLATATAEWRRINIQYPMSKSNFQVNGERPVISDQSSVDGEGRGRTTRPESSGS